MISLRDKLHVYSDKAAIYLRGREANLLRGQPEKLHELELVTDSDLLRKYSWRLAIMSAGACFFAAPVLVSVLSSLVPPLLGHLLWFMVKLGMALSCLTFALAAYYTFGQGSEQG